MPAGQEAEQEAGQEVGPDLPASQKLHLDTSDNYRVAPGEEDPTSL